MMRNFGIVFLCDSLESADLTSSDYWSWRPVGDHQEVWKNIAVEFRAGFKPEVRLIFFLKFGFNCQFTPQNIM